MEFTFFNEWEELESVHVGSQLSNKIVKLKTFDEIEIINSFFPEDTINAGCEIDRYMLTVENKYPFIHDLSQLLLDECYKITHKKPEIDGVYKSKEMNNPQTLGRMIDLILNSATHFSLG